MCNALPLTNNMLSETQIDLQNWDFFPFELTLNIGSELQDIKNLTQNVLDYINSESTCDYLISPNIQAAMTLRFKAAYFRPWALTHSDFSKLEINNIIMRFKRNPGFGENKLFHPMSWIIDLENNIQLSTYPNLQKKGISLRRTSQRLLPTHKPHFNNFILAGEGFPFDNLQNTGIMANTPLYLSHLSMDRAWVLAESPYALGWIPIDDVAFVDNGFINEWQSHSLAAFIQENVPIISEGHFRFNASIGGVLPFANKEIFFVSNFLKRLFPPNANEPIECLVALANANRQAYISICRVSANKIATIPISATSQHIAEIANRMIGQPYGWGDFLGNRDCASMIKDIMVPFGRWLPRNGNVQANQKRSIPLKNVSADVKEQIIIEQGIPWVSLLWMNGHIMLYIGHKNGKAVVLHNIWGLRLQDANHKEGRYIIGKTVVTSLQPGIEIPILKNPLINRIEKLIFLTE